MCDPIDSPSIESAAIVVNDETGDVVGIQVIPLLVGAVQDRPAWAVLAWGALIGFRYEEETLRGAIAAFISEVAELFERYWTPPPIEEQLVRLARAERGDGGAGA